MTDSEKSVKAKRVKFHIDRCRATRNHSLLLHFPELTHRQIPFEKPSGEKVAFLLARDVVNKTLYPGPFFAGYYFFVGSLLNGRHSTKLWGDWYPVKLGTSRGCFTQTNPSAAVAKAP